MRRALIVAVIASVTGCKAERDAPAKAPAADEVVAPASGARPTASAEREGSSAAVTISNTGGGVVTVNGRSVPATSTSGVTSSEKRTVADFSAIDVTGAFHVEAGSGAVAVEVTGDTSLLPLVVTEVTNGTLHIHMRDSLAINASLPSIKLSAPMLKAASVTGAGHTTITGVHGDAFAATTTGAAIVTLAGSADRLAVSATGGGELKALGLTVDDANVDATGAVEVDVAAAKKLVVRASGACHVRYHGNPSVVQDTTGASSISQI